MAGRRLRLVRVNVTELAFGPSQIGRKLPCSMYVINAAAGTRYAYCRCDNNVAASARS
jgi:hypothetical protein